MSSEPPAVREGRLRADALRYELKLGDAPIRDFFGFIERTWPEILVARYPMAGGPEGALLRYRERWLIVINTYDSYLARQRFTGAHELAHLEFDADGTTVLVDEDTFGGKNLTEMRANAFAVHFLLPADALRARFHSADFDLNSDEHVVRLSMEYGLSTQSLAWHLFNGCGISARRRGEIFRIEPYRLAARMGLADRVAREMDARNATSWPASYMSAVTRAFEAGILEPAQLGDYLHDDALVRRLRDALEAS